MGQTAIKNYKKLYSQTGGDPSLATRVTTLENNEYKITYFAEISSSTGSITIPTGVTILLDQLQGGVDAYVCTIQNGQPTGNFPQTGGGVTVDVTSFDALGAYTLSGTPSIYPVALIYILKIKAKDYSNLDITKILDLEDINAVSKAGDTMYGDLTIATLTASQIVETDANKNLISAAKGTAYNKNFGTTSGTVLEGNTIVTTQITDISNTSTIRGFSSYSRKEIYIHINGNSVTVTWWLEGAGSGTDTDFTLPVTSIINLVVNTHSINNGGVATVGRATIAASADLVILGQNIVGSAYSGTGTRRSTGSLTFIKA